MADVAAAGGVSRQTLYNEFGTRDEFAQAFVIREGAASSTRSNRRSTSTRTTRSLR